jgi:hypothetical protein
MKPFRLGVFAVALVLGACTSSPTTTLDPAGPSFEDSDGGNGLGSGNFTGTSDGETTVPVDTVARGPGMLGSGN